jgi:predicted enzyme related to lactoylglutathione lyase
VVTSWRSCVLTVSDVAYAAVFWEAATGFERAVDTPNEVVLTDGGEVGSYPGIVIVQGDRSASGSVHVDLNSDDLEADFRRLTSFGATLVAEQGDQWKMLTDPEGNAFCLRGIADS